jgi:hypothetical protein
MIIPNSPNHFERDFTLPGTLHGFGDTSVFNAFIAVLRISFISIQKSCSTL